MLTPVAAKKRLVFSAPPTCLMGTVFEKKLNEIKKTIDPF
jgi:hypothetical protein